MDWNGLARTGVYWTDSTGRDWTQLSRPNSTTLDETRLDATILDHNRTRLNSTGRDQTRLI
eukprot:7661971-Lingulodinium_polyedra.AAC.1